jgi:DNA-binding MarR family transcriptional regulator
MSRFIDRPPTLLSLPTSYVAGWVSKRARGDIQVALAEYDLTTADHGVLVALGDFHALSQQQLADRLGADKSHVVRLIDQLEHRGLITRSADPTDRRRHRIELTDAGRQLLETIVPITEALDAQHLEPLSVAERDTLSALLQRVLEAQDGAGESAGPTR